MAWRLKVRSTVLAPLLLLCAVPNPANGVEATVSEKMGAAEIYKAASPSVVMVGAELVGGRVSQGSGVVVAPDQIVTNAHVVEGSVGLLLVSQGARVWRAEVESIDLAHDLALLAVLLRRTESFDLPVAQVRLVDSVQIGERAYAIGAPLGLEQTLSEGIISGRPAFREETLLQTTAAISHGSSGGGLFDDRGRLLGIPTLSLKDAQSLNFAVPADHVGALLKAPPALSPAHSLGCSALVPPNFPTAIGSVQAVLVNAVSEGPLATKGDLTPGHVSRLVRNALKETGLTVFASSEEARRAKVDTPELHVSLHSLKVKGTPYYPWSIVFELQDISTMSDGSTRFVSIWSASSHGYGGNQVVLEQVDEELKRVANDFAIAVLKGRATRSAGK